MQHFTENNQINQWVMPKSAPEKQADFLRLVRSGPGFIGFKPISGNYFEKHFGDTAEAISIIAGHGKNADTWVSMATYSNPNAARSQVNAESLCSLWLDVDAHEGSQYQTIDDVKEAIEKFVQAAEIPQPTLLNYTGHGIHAIWAFTQQIPREEWQSTADKLQSLGKRHELGADPITADAARILRVAGTINFRDPSFPLLASIEETGAGLQDFDKVSAAIDCALKKSSVKDDSPGKNIIKRFNCPETKENIKIVETMLSVIEPEIGYCNWRDVVWSVAATSWNCSYELSRSWSLTGKSWEEDTFNRVWDSFSETGGIGFGTLAHFARNFGYTGPLPSNAQPKTFKQASGLLTIRASDVEPEHIEWLVDQSFPLGMLAVIGGQPGLGKSQISINLAAGVTTGKGLPGVSSFTNHGSVIILANEDDAARTIRPRLDAAGADVSKVHIVQGVAREGADVDMFQLDSDISDLRDRALQIGDVRLIIIDPPSAYLGTKVDSYKDSDVRRVLMPLGNLAQQTGAMILLIVHLNKRVDGSPQQRFSGSTAWTAAPRVGFMVVEDAISKQRFMLPVKNNIGNDRLGYQYHIAEKLVHYGDQTFKSSYVVWDQITDRSVTELLGSSKTAKTTVVDDAKEFLEDELENGPRPVEHIKASAKAAGISWPSVNRAKKLMPINSNKVGSGWTWTLFKNQEDKNV